MVRSSPTVPGLRPSNLSEARTRVCVSKSTARIAAAASVVPAGSGRCDPVEQATARRTTESDTVRFMKIPLMNIVQAPQTDQRESHGRRAGRPQRIPAIDLAGVRAHFVEHIERQAHEHADEQPLA